MGERGRLNSCTVQMDGRKEGSYYYNTEFTQYVFNNTDTPLASGGSLKVATQEMFMSQTFVKPKDATATVRTLKCQLLIVLHFCVNSGQMNSLKDKIITHKFNSSRLMAWPLKCHLSKHCLYVPFRRNSYRLLIRYIWRSRFQVLEILGIKLSIE